MPDDASAADRVPAFSADQLNRLRGLLNLSLHMQASVLDDDGATEDLLRDYLWLRGLAVRNPAPAPQTWTGAVLSMGNFEADLAHDLDALQSARSRSARIGGTSKDDTGTDDASELDGYRSHWSALGVEPILDHACGALVYCTSAGRSVSVGARGVTWQGEASNDSIRLAVEHARAHWGGRVILASDNEDFVLRYLVHATLLGVEVKNHAVQPFQQARFDALMAEICRDGPHRPASPLASSNAEVHLKRT